MDQLRKQVERARRRLSLELFLGRLVRCWFVALAAAAIAIAVPKVVLIEGLPAAWEWWSLGAAIVAGLGVALAWTAMRGRTAVEAAMEIDRRFGLKERVASSLSIPADAAATPAGQALLRDAERAVRRLDIDERFRVRLGRSAWLPAAPAAVALAVALLATNQHAETSAAPQIAALSPKAVENSLETLRKRLTEIGKKDPKKNLKDAQDLLLEADRELQRIASQKKADRQKTLAKFNNLAQQLADRRQALGGDQEMRRQLAGMKDLGRGPAEKMGSALKGGNWDQARQELDKLRQQLASGKLDAAANRQLAEQLKKLNEQLSQAAARREQAIEQLKQQVAQQKKAGDLAKAGELQQKLEKLMRQQKGAKQLQQMAQQMADASQNMQKGDQKAAAETLAQMSQQLQQMQEQMEQDSAESQMLDMAMEQLEMTQETLACESCQGEGCTDCQGNMPSNSGGAGGRGIGSGRMAGTRPEDNLQTAFRDTRVKQDPKRGRAVITGEADGPTIRGEVREAVKEEVEAGATDEADAIVAEQLPRTQRENAEEYFNRLRDGE
ncbi:MAG TPA: hypothetical protein VEQ85_09150 [Lacipirellulaceae bacterium]|nr:hypothetical protein [Lacipirellulaceae bacterium]